MCASLVPVADTTTVVSSYNYCQDRWLQGGMCQDGVRPGGTAPDRATSFCIQSEYESGTSSVCRNRAQNQADCDENDYNCMLGYDCIHTSAGNVCRAPAAVGGQCGGDTFGNAACDNGACSGHTCQAYVGKGQKCDASSGSAQCPPYLACNLGKCVSRYSVGDEGHCTTGAACKSGSCLNGHCFTRKMNACESNAECSYGYCNNGVCWAPLQIYKDYYDCLAKNKIDGSVRDTVFALCGPQYAKMTCVGQCATRVDKRSVPEWLALSSVDCATGAITDDATAVANPLNIFKSCEAVANYPGY